MKISKESLGRYRKEFNKRMANSAIWEYCPPEFGELLDYIDHLEKNNFNMLAKIKKVKIGTRIGTRPAIFVEEMMSEEVHQFVNVHGEEWGNEWYMAIDPSPVQGYYYHLSWLETVEKEVSSE